MSEMALPDINLSDCQFLICGINPSPSTAATGAPYATPGNRFWPALYRAGIVPELIDPRHGLSPEAEELLARRGLGFTRLVCRPTRQAAELNPAELRAGAQTLREKLQRAVAAGGGPRTIMFLGLGAYRTAFGLPKAGKGPQDDADLGSARVWLAPNPSGLNAHETVDSLATIFAEVWADHLRRA